QPLILELACGRGEYSLGLARMYPDRNFIGVDVKGARIWQGASIALKEGLNNVAFLRTRIEQLTNFIDQKEVDEIWITFPDPFLRNSKSNRRLTSPNFLKAYRQILKPGGIVHLKTDSPQLYDFSLEVFEADGQVHILYQNYDIYSKPLDFPELEIKTHYERLHLADERKIKYLRFQIN
ncbi:MAG: tRNA (guanosine(46)-N7)-methyltransferase TrmB, partial [Bacteroidota bacterium]